MLLVLNMLLIIFIIGMIYMWSVQGFFSALIHLCVTIAAGTLAFAMWEPISSLIMAWKPTIAMGAGLLLPFGILMIVLRMTLDKLIRKNMQFNQIIGGIGGGACGLVSAVLTSGILIMGLGLLPTGYATFGYQPWTATSGGRVAEEDAKLWIGVDEYAYKVYSTLSRGAFAPTLNMDVNLASARPELPKMIAINKQTADVNASIVATPQEVTIGKVYTRATDDTGLSTAVSTAIGDSLNQTGQKLLVIDTSWSRKDRKVGTYDGDSTFRVSASQVRLVTTANGGKVTKLYGPKAFSKADGDRRIFKAFAQRTDQAWGSDSKDTIAWIFVVPANEDIEYLMVRNLRFELPQKSAWEEDTDLVAAAVGALSEADAQKIADAAASDLDEGEIGAREGARSGAIGEWVEVTNRLPKSVSKNFARNLSVQGSGVTSGYAKVEKGKSGGSARTRIDSFYVPSHQAMLRIKVTPDRAQSLFGQAMASAGALGMVAVKDDRGSNLRAVGYAWLKSDGTIIIEGKDIASAKLLPVDEMVSGDKLYVYFKVNRGRTITELRVGSATQELNVEIPASAK